MTWRHERAIAPMLATSALWQEKTGVKITWEQRSLQDFESFPVEELARAYDLIVIDHPHVGQITAEGCLAPLDVPGREAELAAIAAGSVGQSFASYTWSGRQWALPIDAATQVAAFRPDLLDAAPRDWDGVLGLARAGRVIVPLREPHSLMCFYTLAANLGTPCDPARRDAMMDEGAAARVIAMLAELVALVPDDCFAMDPIAAFEAMAAPDSRAALAPLAYGYVNYAIDGFRPHVLQFADIAVAGGNGPTGSALGGTGIAVSAFGRDVAAATDYALWVAGPEVQGGLYHRAGGQPGHAAGWDSDEANAATHDFYRATRATLEGAWLRPRHDGYMRFQAEASARLSAGLRAREDARVIAHDLNRLYAGSF
ncbi:MAG: extracellular solute-binding protein [Rubellimicrobium sp.]|nr:extracellular solute-binding protein [Rubellimicrobium sp.]